MASSSNASQPANPGPPQPWDSRPEYIAACDTTVRSGGPHAYLRPRPVGTVSATDVTAFHPGQWDWHTENLPSIIYELKPNSQASWYAFKSSIKPGPKVDAQGQVMFERWPRPGQAPRQLRDYKILPDQIGTAEDAWYFEAIRRLDPRVAWEDIVMRMEYTGFREKYETEKEFINTVMNNRGSRVFRKDYHLLAWHTQSPNKKAKGEDELLARLSPAQRAQNTTRGITPGLIVPTLGDVPDNRIHSPIYRHGRNAIRGPLPKSQKRGKKEESASTGNAESLERENGNENKQIGGRDQNQLIHQPATAGDHPYVHGNDPNQGLETTTRSNPSSYAASIIRGDTVTQGLSPQPHPPLDLDPSYTGGNNSQFTAGYPSSSQPPRFAGLGSLSARNDSALIWTNESNMPPELFGSSDFNTSNERHQDDFGILDNTPSILPPGIQGQGPPVNETYGNLNM